MQPTVQARAADVCMMTVVMVANGLVRRASKRRRPCTKLGPARAEAQMAPRAGLWPPLMHGLTFCGEVLQVSPSCYPDNSPPAANSANAAKADATTENLESSRTMSGAAG